MKVEANVTLKELIFLLIKTGPDRIAGQLAEAIHIRRTQTGRVQEECRILESEGLVVSGVKDLTGRPHSYVPNRSRNEISG